MFSTFTKTAVTATSLWNWPTASGQFVPGRSGGDRSFVHSRCPPGPQLRSAVSAIVSPVSTVVSPVFAPISAAADTVRYDCGGADGGGCPGYRCADHSGAAHASSG